MFKGKELKEVLDTLYPAQLEAYLEIVTGEQNVLLTAAGGFGKSYVIDIVKHFHSGRNICTASTGAASVLIGGTTTHSTLGLPLGVPTKENMKKVSKRYRSIFKRGHPVDIIFVDEAPMLGPQALDAILQRLQRIKNSSKSGSVKVVLSGDFSQCLNVVKEKDKDELLDLYGTTITIESKFLNEFKVIELDQNKRVGDNKVFGEMLEKMRMGYDKEEVCRYFNQFVGKPLKGVTTLVPRNAQADLINKEKFEENTNPAVYYHAKIEGTFDKRDTSMSEVLALKVGLQVMCLSNQYKEDGSKPDYVNGSTGIVQELMFDSVKVLLDNGKLVWLEPYVQKNMEKYVDDEGELQERSIGSFSQINLRINYAQSINKAQGVTLDQANIDFGEKGCFSYGQAYTACSRLSNPDGLRLLTPIYPSDIMVHRSVKKFYEKLRGVPQKFKVIVAGGRDFNNYPLLKDKLDLLLAAKPFEDIVIISGGARGADQLGERYAIEKGYPVEKYTPDWNRLGKRAGFVRNTEMADNGDALVLFWDGMSNGSRQMGEVAEERGLSIRVVSY